VGLNSRYTYYLLAQDFSDTCVVAEKDDKIIGFSSGYVPPRRPDTFFNWEIVVDTEHRGNGLQKRMLLHQLAVAKATYLEATINPSNDFCRNNITDLATQLDTTYKKSVMFSEEDFGNDGHETEILYRVGPISPTKLKQLLDN
jgi:L-2,4-diaminobutyric acid acetyltransferase